MRTEQLLRALAFAAEKHRDQRRKDADASPYINHPISVATVLCVEAGVADEPTLIAAILHDTVEDTATSLEELERSFGAEVAALVAELTDDKTLPRDERKRRQVEHVRHASPKAKRLKMADKISNVRDILNTPPATWSDERRIEYIEWAEQVAAGCRGVEPGLDALFDRLVAQARDQLGAVS